MDVVQRPQRQHKQHRPPYKSQQQSHSQIQPLQLPEKVYKRRIRCWQCHDQVEEAPDLFCTKCGARLKWYNIHLDPGEQPVSIASPTLIGAVKHPLAIIGYKRPQGIAGQYKLGALFELPEPYWLVTIYVYEDDALRYHVSLFRLSQHTNPYLLAKQGGKKRWKLEDYLMTGLVPGNLIEVTIAAHEVAYVQKDLFRVLPERIVRVGKEEGERIRQRVGQPYEETATLYYVPLVDLDNLEESLWLEAVHQRNATPEIAEHFLGELKSLITQQAQFTMQHEFFALHSNNTHHETLYRRDTPKAIPEDPVEPVIEDKIGPSVVFELTNRQAALVIYMHQRYEGKEITLYADDYEESKRDYSQYGWEGPDYGEYPKKAEVEVYLNGEETHYAAVFDHLPLTLEYHTKKPRSVTRMKLKTYAPSREEIVYLKPGKVSVVDWRSSTDT